MPVFCNYVVISSNYELNLHQTRPLGIHVAPSTPSEIRVWRLYKCIEERSSAAELEDRVTVSGCLRSITRLRELPSGACDLHAAKHLRLTARISFPVLYQLGWRWLSSCNGCRVLGTKNIVSGNKQRWGSSYSISNLYCTFIDFNKASLQHSPVLWATSNSSE